MLIFYFLHFKVQSVIQPTSVIQSTPSLQATSLPKGNIILVSKPNSVIHTTGGGGGSIQTLQVVLKITFTLLGGGEFLLLMVVIASSQVIDNSGLHEDENTKKRREILARRPSYRKILNELGGCEISGKFISSGLPFPLFSFFPFLFCFSFLFFSLCSAFVSLRRF